MNRALLSCAALSVLLLPAVAFGQREPPPGSTSVGSAAPRSGGDTGSSSASPRGGDTSSSSSSSGNSSGNSGPSSGSVRDLGSSGGSWNSYSPSNTVRVTAPPGIGRDVRSGDAPSLGRARVGTEQRTAVGQPVPAQDRPRGDRPVYGYAVPRGSNTTPPPGGSSYPGFGWYPGAFGYYDDGYYDWYSPMSFGVGGGYSAGGAAYARAANGGLRLKVTPDDAEVYVDMTYAGRVDQFDGALQHLSIPAGTHTIEIRAEGYETLSFDVRIMPGRSVTYQGVLRPLRK